jgi:hypothetical protein
MDILTIRPSLIDEHLDVSCAEKAERNKEIWLQTLLVLLLYLKLLIHKQQRGKY